QQKTPPHHAIHHMHNFVSSKHLSTSQPSHHKPPKKPEPTVCRVLKPENHFNNNAVSPEDSLSPEDSSEEEGSQKILRGFRVTELAAQS
ncbi:MAG: hypothetical protein KDA89_18840, partial [Planctomycetaceae bacterium]|nr:hypothetical protein [Planctomycetaceae bacterium]